MLDKMRHTHSSFTFQVKLSFERALVSTWLISLYIFTYQDTQANLYCMLNLSFEVSTM